MKRSALVATAREKILQWNLKSLGEDADQNILSEVVTRKFILKLAKRRANFDRLIQLSAELHDGSHEKRQLVLQYYTGDVKKLLCSLQEHNYFHWVAALLDLPREKALKLTTDYIIRCLRLRPDWFGHCVPHVRNQQFATRCIITAIKYRKDACFYWLLQSPFFEVETVLHVLCQDHSSNNPEDITFFCKVVELCFRKEVCLNEELLRAMPNVLADAIQLHLRKDKLILQAIESFSLRKGQVRFEKHYVPLGLASPLEAVRCVSCFPENGQFSIFSKPIPVSTVLLCVLAYGSYSEYLPRNLFSTYEVDIARECERGNDFMRNAYPFSYSARWHHYYRYLARFNWLPMELRVGIAALMFA